MSSVGSRVIWGVFIPPTDPIEGVNERCIELPLALDVLALDRPGRVLDAGCALNGHLLPEIQASVYHLTQNIASEHVFAHATSPLSYLSGDLRDLTLFAGAAFDRVVCISTLEHVGLDNSGYLAAVEKLPHTMYFAVKELVRITRTELLITVPYSEPAMSCAQWRFLGEGDLAAMAGVAERRGFTTELRYYAKTEGGWYGGDTVPVEASRKDFPQSVNAIACLRCTQ